MVPAPWPARGPAHRAVPSSAVFAFVSLGGTPVSIPQQLIKPNITFWAALEKNRLSNKGENALCPMFPVLVSGQQKEQIRGIWKREAAEATVTLQGLHTLTPAEQSPRRPPAVRGTPPRAFGAKGNFYPTGLKC